MPLVKSIELTDEQEKKLEQLIQAIPNLVSKTEDPSYDEIYGYRIAADEEEYVDVENRNEILLKFLIAREYDVAKAQEMLVNTLNWRRKFQVLSAAYNEKFDESLEKMGVITDYKDNKDNFSVVTWNLYANLKNPKKLFAKFGVGVDNPDKTDLPGTMFLRWRVGIMERSLALLNFGDVDKCKIAQVHDYNNVSMFRMDPGMKAATKEIITIFSDNYPELLSKKYFINVPYIMGWVFSFFKATGFMSAATLKKFEMLNHGNLSSAFGKENLPKDYNGGQANDKIPDIFASQVEDASIKIPEYGAIILERLKKKQEEERATKEGDKEEEAKAEEETSAADADVDAEAEAEGENKEATTKETTSA
ncbi:uncharacterized protein CXQ87_004511 [Candidozyma duobushaemuli]|uniref:Phosphatidylinositol transfer protein SFH5 n=2 Tax=Candidozyma TaxID=3303203 RepID=A0ABX8IAK4_9ASCO|nr:uncharacterized protein CXQ87_004511 [[Candida] duobushaemulonis]PVH16953.1 hypothetical protein CXQ87_004511 [[Candida] duobushaemulonis]QWU89725.1 hypothetical protein CA3LBN_004073 [[Candida] haemuloni]